MKPPLETTICAKIQVNSDYSNQKPQHTISQCHKLDLCYAILYNIQMGNYQTHNGFIQKYKFIHRFADPHFGLIDVYIKQQFSYSFIMCLKKVIDEPKMLHKIMCRLDMIKRATHIMQNSVLLKLHYFTVKESSWIQCTPPEIQAYYQYPMASMKQILKHYRVLMGYFSLGELIYLVRAAFIAFNQMKSINPNHFTIALSTVFLTKSGFVRFLPFEPESFQVEDECYQLCHKNVPYSQPDRIYKNQKHFLSQIKKLLYEMLRVNQNTFYHPQNKYYTKQEHQMCVQYFNILKKTQNLEYFIQNCRQTNQINIQYSRFCCENQDTFEFQSRVIDKKSQEIQNLSSFQYFKFQSTQEGSSRNSQKKYKNIYRPPENITNYKQNNNNPYQIYYKRP